MYKLIIFGVSNSLKKLETIIDLKKVEIISYCDNNKNKIGTLYNNIKIVSPNELLDVHFDYILIAPRGVLHRKAIFSQLLTLGIDKNKIIDFYDYLNPVESTLKPLEGSNNYETLITGLSYALHGIDIECFKRKTLNLALESQDLYYDYKMLELVLDKYKAKNKFSSVIMNLSYYSFQYDLSKSEANADRVCMYYNVFRDLHNYKKEINRYLVEKHNMYNKCKKVFICDFENIISDLPDNVLTNDQINSNKNLPFIDSNKNYPLTVEENKEIFESYMDLLKRNSVRPIVVIFPTTKYYYEKFSITMRDEFYKIIKDYERTYKFELYDYFSSNLFNDNDFVDISHLNKIGARKMSIILNEIVESK